MDIISARNFGLLWIDSVEREGTFICKVFIHSVLDGSRNLQEFLLERLIRRPE
jgi:hypothetical protein